MIADQSTAAQQPGDQPEHTRAAADPLPTQHKTDGPMDTAEFAAGLDIDPERDDVKG